MAHAAEPDPITLPGLKALSRRPMMYRDAAQAASMGLTPFVRAASSVALVRGRLVVVQDDVHALAIVDASTALADPVPLPIEGPLARVKATKVDLEACSLLPDGTMLVMGSGSRPNRRVAFVLEAGDAGGLVAGEARVRELAAGDLYAALEAALPPGQRPLNVEGVSISGQIALFLHRGAGRGGGDAGPPNVLLRASTRAVLASLEGRGPQPEVRATAVALGAIDGVELTWTDGVEVYGVGLVFTASAEDTRDVTADGACAGAALGVLRPDGRVGLARLLDATGAPLAAKVEGLALQGDRAFLVVDDDDEAKAADLIEVAFGAIDAGEGAAPTPG